MTFVWALVLTCSVTFLLWWLGNVIYSIWFSPLKDIPSPLIYQLFPIYFEIILATGNSPQILHTYVETYGRVFRAGWRLVLFTDDQASYDMYSTYQLPKSNDYDIFSYFGKNLLTIQDRTAHSARRRKAGSAFTKSSINQMIPIMMDVGVKPLMRNFEVAEQTGVPIDLFHQFHFFSWDVVGKLTFGESFDMLTNGLHPAVKWLDSVLHHGMLTLALPFMKYVKNKDGERLKKFAHDVMDRYYERCNDQDYIDPSIIGHFAREVSLSRQEVVAESFIQLFAGTDTSSNTLNWFFYLVLTHPHVEERLYQELKEFQLLNPKRIIEWDEIHGKLPYYEATMKEAMRILPVVPNTPFRMIPKGGRTISGIPLPEGTKVAVPIYSLHRVNWLWSKGDQFLPERWLDPTSTIHKNSFIPFSMGPRACIGKYLAWAELDLVTINLLANYKFHLLDPTEGEVTEALPTLRPKSMRNHVHVIPHPTP